MFQPDCLEGVGVPLPPPDQPADQAYSWAALSWLLLLMGVLAIDLILVWRGKKTLSQWMTWKARRHWWFPVVIGLSMFVTWAHFFWGWLWN
jgi:hypothetical protein